jgi:hypothetical protein
MKTVPRYLINEKKNTNISYVDVILEKNPTENRVFVRFRQKTKKNA